MEDKVYTYPYAVESQVLYYNKDTYSPEEIKTWKSLTEKGKIGTNFGEDGINYIFGPLFIVTAITYMVKMAKIRKVPTLTTNKV